MNEFPIPDAALTQHIAILGKTGSGKTHDTKGIVEHVASEQHRVCILDPIKSDWWGITSSADGKRPGLPFHILGGPHGHVPLHASSGKALAEIVASGALPLSIMDMREFGPGDHSRFFAEFAAVLLKRMRGVLYLVLEEAHLFAPKERSGMGNENMAIHWAKTLATAGRSTGIRMIVATQRTQALHNALLGSCDTMIAHRLTSPADQEPVLKWFKANTDKEKAQKVADTISGLKTGTAWVYSGEARFFDHVSFPRIATFDNSRTPTGSTAEIKVSTAPVDLSRLRTIIGDAVKEAEANDPMVLKAQIESLRGQLIGASKPAAKINTAPDETAALRDREAAFAAGKREGWSEGYPAGWLEGERSGFTRGVAAHHGEINSALKDAANVAYVPGSPPKRIPKSGGNYADPMQAPVAHRIEHRVPNPKAAGSNPAGRTGAAAPGLGAERRPLAVLAAAHPAGMTEAQWAVAAGLKRSGGTWATYLSRLRTAGAIEKRDGEYFATETGIEALGGQIEPMPSPGPDLVEFWIGRIAGIGPMLRALASEYPKWMTRDELADALSMAAGGGTFSTYISRLKSPGLIEVDRQRGIRAAPALMEGHAR